jgi:FAD/FMN-containing dehydrogenase
LVHKGVVIDLSAMRRVTIDPVSRFATLAGGATARDVIDAAAPHELAAVTGYCDSIGMAGLTLGGGYGPLSGRYGLAADNLLRADVVLANGQFVTADTTQNQTLLWALRGGGGNFGAATSMQIRLHPLRQILAGIIVFPWSQVEQVLRGYADVMESAPDELTVVAGVLSGLMAPVSCGELDLAEPFIDVLRNLGKPIHSLIRAMSYGGMPGAYDGHSVPGRHYAACTRWLAKLSPRAIVALVAAGAARTSPFSFVRLQHVHGAAARIADRNSAFGLRRNHYLVEIIAAWAPAPGQVDEGISHRLLWAQDLSKILAQDALPGGYPNLLGPDDHEQIASAYGCNLAALQQAKRRFDPDAVFSATPLPTEMANASESL